MKKSEASRPDIEGNTRIPAFPDFANRQWQPYKVLLALDNWRAFRTWLVRRWLITAVGEKRRVIYDKGFRNIVSLDRPVL